MSSVRVCLRDRELNERPFPHELQKEDDMTREARVGGAKGRDARVADGETGRGDEKEDDEPYVLEEMGPHERKESIDIVYSYREKKPD